MPISLAPIQPSSPPPPFCAECGGEVDPAAWLCAECGSSLHEPGATTSKRPYSSVSFKRSKPGRSICEVIFSTVLVAGFWFLYDALTWHLLPAKYTAEHEGALLVVLGVAFLVILWGEEFSTGMRSLTV
jgi:hypothetical protein